MILIITSKQDSHVAAVTTHIEAAGVEWVRINTEDASRNLSLEISPATGDGRVRIDDSKREFRFRDIQAVWYRKPEPVDISHLDLAGGARDYVEAEFREILDGMYGMLCNVPWINNPHTTRLAHRKMVQLEVASRLGFLVPRTLVTNDIEAALNFASSINGDLAIKSLGSLSVIDEGATRVTQYGIFTRRVGLQELRAVAHTIPALPTTFQEFIQKKYEIRVNAVGDELFATRIEPRAGDLTADDYRFDTKRLTHRAVECPLDLSRRLRDYMKVFGLHFAAFDLIVTPADEIVFLECNPNGQWLWIQELTGLPIGATLGRYLLAASERTTRTASRTG